MNDIDQLDFFTEASLIELEDDNVRTCTDCNKTKPLSDFPTHPTMYKRRRGQCKVCTNENVTTIRILRLKNRYPNEDYRCPICNTSRRGIKRRNGTSWVLDHCHSTKQFRGWLCENCNSGIGKLKDSVEFLQRAIKYLERNLDYD